MLQPTPGHNVELQAPSATPPDFAIKECVWEVITSPLRTKELPLICVVRAASLSMTWAHELPSGIKSADPWLRLETCCQSVMCEVFCSWLWMWRFNCVFSERVIAYKRYHVSPLLEWRVCSCLVRTSLHIRVITFPLFLIDMCAVVDTICLVANGSKCVCMVHGCAVFDMRHIHMALVAFDTVLIECLLHQCSHTMMERYSCGRMFHELLCSPSSNMMNVVRACAVFEICVSPVCELCVV